MDGIPTFPSFDIEGQRFSKLILGHNPLIGGSYMSRARSRVYQETLNAPEAVRDIVIQAIRSGVRSMMLGVTGEKDVHVMAGLEAAQEETGVKIPTIIIVNRGFEEHVELLHRVNCAVCLIHGQLTDALFDKEGRTMKPEFEHLTRSIRQLGFIPGMSTHNAGEVIPAAEQFDVAVINTPINKVAWRMCPCEELVLRAIRQTTKRVIAMKSLAMGRIAPDDAMQYICRVPDVDGVVVGIGHPYEAEETFGEASRILGAMNR
ncbi:MAG: hypothetical protein HN742_17060 [Lentisphaerae bacterium]|jgi:hypothetical protein|nr:hypothetical protein [Lentisphaerota bacterium]MBT4815948.1 hypothetical protein [Lentisphaerota bacterium]MBT5606872.1 hypothetical protein [Lentisphaerota bacterium]MBT7059019.1 hypothetical protein [Lentisphaerota bacterium]MBT7843591.1 hypothetical protein [Lentisphaerota bacterium]